MINSESVLNVLVPSDLLNIFYFNLRNYSHYCK